MLSIGLRRNVIYWSQKKYGQYLEWSRSQTHHTCEERIWYTLSAFLGAQDVVRHVTVMTTHHFGIATHQPLSRIAIAGYSVVSHVSHMVRL